MPGSYVYTVDDSCVCCVFLVCTGPSFVASEAPVMDDKVCCGLPCQLFKLSDWGEKVCKSLQLGYSRSPMSTTIHVFSVWPVAAVWKSSIIYYYPLYQPVFSQLGQVQNPESEPPGVAGVSAKRLAANIGEGAMSPRQNWATDELVNSHVAFGRSAAMLKLMSYQCLVLVLVCYGATLILQERTCKTSNVWFAEVPALDCKFPRHRKYVKKKWTVLKRHDQIPQ